MKTCEECGAIVSDDETVCPECGGTAFSESHGLELRSDKGPKKRPVMDTDISSNMEKGDFSDLEQDVYGGSGGAPISVSKAQLKEMKSVEKHGKKYAKKASTGMGTFFLILVLIALGVGVYLLFTQVILKNDGPESQEACVEMFKEAVNAQQSKDDEVRESAQAKMEYIMPPYLSIAPGQAEEILGTLANVEITKMDETKSTPADTTKLNDYVQMERGKTAKITEAFEKEFRVTAYVTNSRGQKIQKIKDIRIILICIKDRWYFYNEDYDFSKLIK